MLLHTHACQGPAVHLTRKKPESIASLILGPVHGHVGMLDERLHILSIPGRNTYADAAGNKKFVIVYMYRESHSFQDFTGDLNGIIRYIRA